MTLETYQGKRHFGKTPEPSGETRKHSPGKKPPGPLRFVVQKHAASHLHYDFRLEVEGVLKSWAVPKGPSLDPTVKRLAMAVEDHPLDYAGFEGTIPKGNYGAGTVMVWDEGSYTVSPDLDRAGTEAAILEGSRNGKLTFQLQGSKLQGEFALVKTHQDANGWLLIKHKDEYAIDEDILEKETSALTRRTMAEITEGVTPAIPIKKNPTAKVAKKAQGSTQKNAISATAKQPDPFPHNLTPMTATLVDQPFSKPGWVYEIKWDGYRAIAELEGKVVRFYSRNHQPFEAKYPAIVEALTQLADRSLILDGEVVVLDSEGRAHFQGVQDLGKRGGELTYMVFDLLYCDGKDLRSRPLLERKALLKTILPKTLPHIRYCDYVEDDGEGFFQVAEAQGLEGMIAKEGHSVYRAGTRSTAWLKVKTQQRQEAIICGYTEPKGSREGFGALILGVYEDGRLHYIGHTGTGFTSKSLKNLKQRFTDYETADCPFAKRPVTNQKATWLKPALVCEVKFTQWTEDNLLRQPVFLGLREDKPAESVTRENQLSVTQALKTEREEAQSKLKLSSEGKAADSANQERQPFKKSTFAKEAPNAERSKILSIQGREVAITHPKKVLWPETGYTKLDMANYYRKAAPYILPYLKDRPFVMNRFPHGIDGDHFYQKDQPDSLPEWIETVSIYSESNERELRYLLCQNEETLIYLANQGCIEAHVWNVRQQHLHQPDWMVIDLDPEAIGFESVIETARVVHDVLTDVKAAHFCKTSGATGLHIYVPMGAQYEEDTVRSFAELVATLVHQQLPRITSLERSPAKRQKKIYLDYLQNRFGQALISPFSICPTAEATVSMPLAWSEVKKGLHPSQFTLANAPERFQDAEKLWQGYWARESI